MQTLYSQDATNPQRADIPPSEARSLAWLTRIPATAVRKLPKPDKPGPMAFVRLTCTLLFMLFVAWAAYLIGMWPISIIFIVVCIAGFFGAHNVGERFTKEAFSHYGRGRVASEAKAEKSDASKTEAKEPPGSAEAPAQSLGLLDASDPTVRMLMAPLPKSLKTRITEARTNENAATASWLGTTEGFRTVNADSGDGTPLVAHALAANPRSPRWVIFAHDYHGSWEDGLLYARHYAQRGFNLLFVEMRGHGNSGGGWIGMGYLDSLDLLAWCNWVVDAYGSSVSIALHGVSMGAAAALLCAGESSLPSQVRAVVCENAFTDAWNAIISLYHGLGMDVHPAIDLVRHSLRRKKGGYDLALASPIDYLDDVNIPVLFAHAAHDTLVPPYMSVQMYRAAVDKHPDAGHAIASFDHAGHQMCCLGDEQEFYSTVFDFLDAHL